MMHLAGSFMVEKHPTPNEVPLKGVGDAGGFGLLSPLLRKDLSCLFTISNLAQLGAKWLR